MTKRDFMLRLYYLLTAYVFVFLNEDLLVVKFDIVAYDDLNSSIYNSFYEALPTCHSLVNVRFRETEK